MPTPSQKTSVKPNGKTLSGVLLYENRDAYARALDLYAYLAFKIAKEIPLDFSWWEFSMLNNKPEAEAARAAVGVADLVIVAAHPAADWSREFKLWVESWTLPKQKRLSAVGALLTPTDSYPNGICGRHAYLQYVAASLEVEFLTAAADPTASLMKAKLESGATIAEPEFEPMNVVDRPDYSPYCGING